MPDPFYFDGKDDLLHQLVDARLASGHLRPGELFEERDPSDPGEIGPLALRDPPFTLPLDCGGKPEFAGECLASLANTARNPIGKCDRDVARSALARPHGGSFDRFLAGIRKRRRTSLSVHNP